MNIVSIRGATTVENDQEEDIILETIGLLQEVINKNKLSKEDIISINFTATRDLKSAYPARAARELGLTNVSLMCFQEMYVENSLEKCIRLGLLARSKEEQSLVKHIYLNKAGSLRPDLTGGLNE